MKRVWMWRADDQGSSTYRVRWVADALRQYFDDVEVRHGTLLSVRDRNWEPEVILGQRVCLPGPSHRWRQWSKQGRVLITDFDDDLFSVPSTNLRASGVFNSRDIRQRMIENVLLSDWVTVATVPLRDAVARHTGFDPDRIVVVPNAVPESLVVDEVPEPGSGRHTLGYLASSSHGPDFKMLRRHLERFLDNHPGATFVSVGHDYAGQLDRPEAVHRRWSRPETAIRSIDYEMSLAPLLPGVFNASKSHCKWVEASARGVVTVASDVTAYAEVEHCVKVGREHEWGHQLQRLWHDPELRYRLAVAAHRQVRHRHTMRSTVPLWHEVLSRGKA